MTADRLGEGLFRRGFVQRKGYHFKRLLIHAAHEIRVEFPRAAGLVGVFDNPGHAVVTADKHLISTISPQQHLDRAVDIDPVGLRHLRSTVDPEMPHRHLALVALHRHGDVFAARGRFVECAAERRHRHIARIQNRRVFHRNVETVQFHAVPLLLHEFQTSLLQFQYSRAAANFKAFSRGLPVKPNFPSDCATTRPSVRMEPLPK